MTVLRKRFCYLQQAERGLYCLIGSLRPGNAVVKTWPVLHPHSQGQLYLRTQILINIPIKVKIRKKKERRIRDKVTSRLLILTNHSL